MDPVVDDDACHPLIAFDQLAPYLFLQFGIILGSNTQKRIHERKSRDRELGIALGHTGGIGEIQTYGSKVAVRSRALLVFPDGLRIHGLSRKDIVITYPYLLRRSVEYHHHGNRAD